MLISLSSSPSKVSFYFGWVRVPSRGGRAHGPIPGRPGTPILFQASTLPPHTPPENSLLVTTLGFVSRLALGRIFRGHSAIVSGCASCLRTFPLPRPELPGGVDQRDPSSGLITPRDGASGAGRGGVGDWGGVVGFPPCLPPPRPSFAPVAPPSLQQTNN